jgi:hypothetical protein
MELPKNYFSDCIGITLLQLPYSNISVTYPSSNFSTLDVWGAKCDYTLVITNEIFMVISNKHYPRIQLQTLVLPTNQAWENCNDSDMHSRGAWFDPQPLQADTRRVPQIRLLLLPFSSIPIHYSLIIPSFNAMLSDLLIASLDKTYVNKIT